MVNVSSNAQFTNLVFLQPMEKNVLQQNEEIPEHRVIRTQLTARVQAATYDLLDDQAEEAQKIVLSHTKDGWF